MFVNKIYKHFAAGMLEEVCLWTCHNPTYLIQTSPKIYLSFVTKPTLPTILQQALYMFFFLSESSSQTNQVSNTAKKISMDGHHKKYTYMRSELVVVRHYCVNLSEDAE